MEHWGTLSVKDHVDARALATEVLIYDRLVMPDWTMGDYQRWQTEGWEPDKLRKRMQQLREDIAYPETWSAARRVDWDNQWKLLGGLVYDAGQLANAPTEAQALQLTRLRLAQTLKPRLPEGHVRPEVTAVARSLEKAVLPVPSNMARDQAADYVVGVRLTFPDADDPEDALTIALDLARDDTFKSRRNKVRQWQRDLIARWSAAESDVTQKKINEAIAALDEEIKAYSEFVCGKRTKRRTETAITFGLIGVGGLAMAFDPTVGAAVGLTASKLGGLISPAVAKLGAFGALSLLQVKKHNLAAAEPDAAARIPVVGAMFHQVREAQQKNWWTFG
jgi:hypothetical protein